MPELVAGNARVIIEVTAGLIPGTPDPQYTRLFSITSGQWQEAGEKDKAAGEGLAMAELLSTVNGQAQGYAAMLMLMPERLNWVRTDWLWL